MQCKNLRDAIPLRLLYIKLGTTQLQKELSFSFYTTTCFGLFSGHHKVVNLQLHRGLLFKSHVHNIYLFIYQAVQCFHILLRPFNNYIIFFFQLLLSLQSSSINPFSPISPLIPSAQVSLGLPRFLLPGGRHFITSLAISLLAMSIPPKLFGFNTV